LQRVFGENFRRARLAAGWSQSEASRRSGVPQPNISLLERGQFNASLRTMDALARIIGKSVTELLTPSSKKK
jgi:transcriptional regulator with XRE-family HTH domain